MQFTASFPPKLEVEVIDLVPSFCVSWFLVMLCTTSMVQSYIVPLQPWLYTIVHKGGGAYFFQKWHHSMTTWLHVTSHNEFLAQKDHGMYNTWAAWTMEHFQFTKVMCSRIMTDPDSSFYACCTTHHKLVTKESEGGTRHTACCRTLNFHQTKISQI